MYQERFVDTKGIIVSRNSKERQYNGQSKWTSNNLKKTSISHTNKIKRLKFEEHEHNYGDELRCSGS